jgi:general secretion pathway protein B
VVAYNELPEDVRRQLPRLVFGGSVHSEQAADRILIVNSQLLREGETVAPGVVLEQIKRQSAVFKYGGYRYEMSY